MAAFFGTEREIGAVLVGKRANLLLLDGNPLQDVGYTAGPAGVMVAGRWRNSLSQTSCPGKSALASFSC